MSSLSDREIEVVPSSEPVRDRSFLNDPIFVNGSARDPNLRVFGRGNLVYSDVIIRQGCDYGVASTLVPRTNCVFSGGVIVMEGECDIRCHNHTIIVDRGSNRDSTS